MFSPLNVYCGEAWTGWVWRGVARSGEAWVLSITLNYSLGSKGLVTESLEPGAAMRGAVWPGKARQREVRHGS